MGYRYTMEYYSAITNNEVMSFAATWMDLEIIILSEVSQKRQISYCLHVEFENNRNESIYETDSDMESKHGYQRGKGGGAG